MHCMSWTRSYSAILRFCDVDVFELFDVSRVSKSLKFKAPERHMFMFHVGYVPNFLLIPLLY